MWKRFWNCLKSVMSGGFDRLESPEQLLAQAQTEMREQQARNRARAVQAVTAKNNLRQQVNDMKKRIDSLNVKADAADVNGDSQTAQKLRLERDAYQESLTTMEASLMEAEAMTDHIKKAIEYEEKAIQQKTAEALALIAWRKSHIYRDMNHAMNHAMNPASKNAADPLLWWVAALYVLFVLLVVLVMWLAGRG